MYWLSSAEGEKLVKSVEDACEKVKRLGMNPLRIPDKKIVKKKAET